MNSILSAPLPTDSPSMVDMWTHPATINRNNFIHKSLSCWSFNPAVGCSHGCRFCYVPEVSVNKMATKLSGFGVKDPDAEWGKYIFLRSWDEKKFLSSLQTAETTPPHELNEDGNRAVMLSTTTDPYQVIRHPDPHRQRELFQFSRNVIRRALELIRDQSTLNVRILTRSPLAEQDFDLYSSLGNRLVFGMSLPTLDNQLARIYEPNAPSPNVRLKTLRAARAAGLNIYVAIAPTYPESGYAEIKRVMEAVAPLEPITIFHEPINMRANNVGRIAVSAQSLGVKLKTEPYANKTAWRAYAREALQTAWNVAADLGLQDRLHLWPDENLGSQVALSELSNPFEYLKWLQARWARISEWP